FFGSLLALICQHLSMVDVVLLLHGRCQPLARLQPLLRRCFRQHYLGGRGVSGGPWGLCVNLRRGLSLPPDGSFGPRLLELCNRGLFECLALNLHCLRGERGALGALISDRIRRLSADVPPSLVGWLTAVVGLRLQAVLEQMPVTPEQVLPYVRHLGEPPEAPPRQVSDRRLSADVPPSLVGWLTAVVGLRLQAVLEQMPVTPEQVLPYVRHLGEPPEAPPRQ
ncbi:large proline-rich protein BAG6, partial [Passer montanus]|uniref:large proline-rich protein BAG6 n=1 Tax=Passer montanus TaxID=9160 RepID=UPI001961142E